MKTLIAIAAVATITACSSESAYDRIIRERDAKIAAIPAEIDREYVAKYGEDRSKWPQAPNIPSTCQTYHVAVSAGGTSSSGNILIC